MFDAPPSETSRSIESGQAGYADVIVPRRLRRAFTYLIPRELAGLVTIGRQVVIPFGTQALHGLVVGLHAELPRHAPRGSLKSICALADSLPDQDLAMDRLELLRWVAEYYAASWGQCITLVLPPGGGRPPRMRRQYVATEQGRTCLLSDARLDELERVILERLRRRRNGLSPAALAKAVGRDPARLLRRLAELGFVRLSEELVTAGPSRGRKPVPDVATPPSFFSAPIPELPEGSQEAAAWPATIRQSLERTPPATVMLQANRDTRVRCLLQAVQATKRLGRRALVVTGEVEQAVRLATLLTELGEPAMLLHGGLSSSERAAVWQAARSGAGDILVGTRLAVFAPVPKLGLLWVEGEDESSLKEEQAPRYHAREVARHRSLREGAVLVLASNHPSLETWREVEQGAMIPAVYRDIEHAPALDVIDLKRFSTGTLLTPRLCDGMRDALQQGRLAILYLNRKGYASVLHCRDCGAMPQCSACSVPLTFHKVSRLLRCHYCGRTKALPDGCLQCRSPHLEPVGSGTERVEEAVRRLFPQARVGRMDSDTIRRPAEARALARLLADHELDILIGTEMLFRLPSMPPAAFVGVPDADAGLHVSDFRSAERTYHGLVDAVELAQAGGTVMLQTRFPDHHAIASVAAGDPTMFLRHELAFRAMLQYPPFTHLIRLDVSGRVESAVAQAAHRWAESLRAALAAPRHSAVWGTGLGGGQQAGQPGSGTGDDVIILGPSPAPKLLVRGRYCWQILIKSNELSAGRAAVIRTLDQLEHEQRTGQLRFDVEVDPLVMT